MHAPDLAGRTALVTGSAKGIGRELLLAIADCGADVAVNYHTSSDGAAEVAEQARERDVDAVAVQGDVTDQESVDSLFDSVEDDLGAVDVLVNNVGAFAPEHWAEMDLDTWQRVMDTNLTGTYLCSKRALPEMCDRSWGRIVNIGYASAEQGMVSPKNFPYFVAKKGVLMFTRMLASETQDDGVTVNAVSPYTVENSDVFPADLPRGRPASFEDVVAAALFFLGEDASYVSGENLEIDGGWLPERV